jgi:Coenzyme PQQ synthesis protein D (PqqD)
MAPRGAHRTETLDVLPTRNPKIIFKALATGAVLYSPQDEVYFGLNPVGVRVWELLPPASQQLDEVCRTLQREYPDAPAEMIRADVAELLEELEKLGLVVPADASARQSS